MANNNSTERNCNQCDCDVANRVLMTGNEAVARGVYEAGVHFAAAYPGTPSTEIMENVATYADVHAQWSPNEKVALEFAIGCAVAGARAFASMKHVGLNVAADPLMTVSYSGATAGLVVVTADEPGMHSSQNEQDNRNYARMAKIPMLEPSNSQECKDYVKYAYEIFDQFGAPVLIRMTTRVCHSKSIVQLGTREQVPLATYVKNVQKFVTVPANARKLRVALEDRMDALKNYSNTTQLNRIEDNGARVGVIASGMCYNYAKELFGDTVNYLKVGFSYPLPSKLIGQFCQYLDKVYVIEENDEFIEEAVRVIGYSNVCYGKYQPSGERYLPPYGEMTVDVLRKVIYNVQLAQDMDIDSSLIVARPPTLCAGCPHRGFFYTVGKRPNTVIAGDIGCYTLGFTPPYNATDFNNCMGASVSAGAGMQQVFDKIGKGKRVVSVIGDSTFFHSGMTSLLEVVYNKSNNIVVILDNRITGMTGHQENPGTGYTLQGQSTKIADIESIVRALGVDNVRTVNPNDLAQVNNALDWAYAIKDQPTVIITKYPCALKRLTQLDKNQFSGAFTTKCHVNTEKCVGCKLCLKSGCPAISVVNKKARIDALSCVGCTVCKQICRIDAIE
ncbi:MAG: indolepyruvate ferredoxin oxidoreductase subunit alpha [Clostridia bacterium]|nr:indolepyruvate ferredoxin oxidoreductase subunit alpha [Clostridia bacterium]